MMHRVAIAALAVLAAGPIDAPLTAQPGDAERGRQIVANRQLSACLLCHAVPFGEARLQATLAPSLAGVGARLSAAEIRARLIDASRENPDTIMPSYYKTTGLTRVGAAWNGKPILTAQQIEDVVAFLATLRAP